MELNTDLPALLTGSNLSGGANGGALNSRVVGVTTGALGHTDGVSGKDDALNKSDGSVRHTATANRLEGWAAPAAEGPHRDACAPSAQFTLNTENAGE